MADDDYYAILEIERTASSDEVKRAYRKQALRWHPDKNPDNKEEAEERFKKIAEAYEVLSDENKKATYDRFGKKGLNNSGPDFTDEDAGYAFDGSQFFFGGAGPRSRRAHNFMFSDPFEIFRQVFGDDPFMSMDSAFFNGGSNRTGSSHRHRNGHNMGTMQTFGFPGFGFPAMSLFGDDPFANFGNVQVQSFSSSGGFGGGGSFRSVSSSTRVVNGKQVTTTRIVENGSERVEVKENGELKSVKVNGVEQMVDYRPQQPQRQQTHAHAHAHAHTQQNGYAHHPYGHAQDGRASMATGSSSASARRSNHGGSASHSRVESTERQHEIRPTSSYSQYGDAQSKPSASRKANPKKSKANNMMNQ